MLLLVVLVLVLVVLVLAVLVVLLLVVIVRRLDARLLRVCVCYTFASAPRLPREKETPCLIWHWRPLVLLSNLPGGGVVELPEACRLT